MIFREELLSKVLDGSKTVTRRPVKYRKYIGTELAAPPHPIQPCRYRVGGGPGGTYALQGPPERGSRARARTIPGYRLRVLRVNWEYVLELTDAEARLEGFVDSEAFFRYFIALYPGLTEDDLIGFRVHRIEFEPVPATTERSGG